MPSLLHCLMVTMAEDRSYRVATSSIGAMRGLITSLPHAVLQDHLPQIVVGLAGHIGGSGCVNLKIETVQAAKALMQIMKPNSVVEVLLSSDCIGAKSSKMRENSLLFLIYATLTFPSTEFHWDQMAGPVAAAVADPRRRVRQAALDALSVIAQFATPSLLDEAVKVVADRQPNLLIRTAYLAGVQARLARRQLPTTSPDGLILYVPQIPSARKGGFSGTPIGSDVEWVLAGSGSVSSGSARSRGQLIAAQRLDPRATLSPKGDNSSVAPVKKGNPWTDRKEVVASGVGAQQLAPIDPEKSQVNIGFPQLPRLKAMKRFLIVDEQRPRFGVSSWTSDLDASQNGISSSQGTFRPLYLRFQSPPDIDNLNNDSVEKGSFSLLPNRLSESTVSSRGSQGVGREKLSQTWPPPSSGCHSPQIPNTSSKRGRRILEPLNTTSPHDGSPHRGVSPARRVSPAHRGTSPTPSAILPMPRGMSPLPVGVNSGVRHKIPPLSPRKKKDWVADSGFGITANGKNDRVVDSTSVKKNRRRKHSTNKGKEIVAIQHNSSPPDEDQAKLSSNFKGEAADDCTIPQKPVLARQGVRHDLSPAGMFPENGSKIPSGLFTPPAEPFLPPVDPSTPQLSRIKTSPVPQEQDDLEFKSFDETDEAGREDSPSHAASSTVSAMDALEAEERALKFQLLKEQEQLESVTVSPVPIVSAPPTIESPVITTEVIELDTNSRGGVLPLHNLQFSPPILSHEESAEDVNNEHQVPQATYSTGSVIDLHLNVEDNFQNETVAPIKQTRRIKHQVGPKIPATTLRGTQFRDRTRTQQNSGLFPDTLHPVDKPKEALQQCFMYLDNSEWEVTLQGLKLLMRLMRHHPETIHTQLHSVIVAVGKQVRNLRSQVARAACQASGELFLSQKRALETDLDELVSSLLHRTADTNRFLRADSNAALDKMIEVISPSRAVAVITGKGISHQNAIVRTASARLLVSLVSKIGVDKVMSHSGDMRDKILIAGSNLLTEGSLDTRCFAKQLFRMLSTHPTFSPVLSEVIPSHILRNISKTLQSLK
ncbi:TOG array regulator of axonemal microtubules protein 1 isoform X2 [Zootermopsis nevadensis]|uniref:TOG array regulator of axonemal microtubules protein 1 isoform X2 n=1 Tax=Zootermopsis nevadensis TaxID=136037 RepID=UPI000B8EB65A|nr:TOG array regulator of axonemal microtubules protein 1 isoform X2 [Zootermopsis nevadensis]